MLSWEKRCLTGLERRTEKHFVMRIAKGMTTCLESERMKKTEMEKYLAMVIDLDSVKGIEIGLDLERATGTETRFERETATGSNLERVMATETRFERVIVIVKHSERKKKMG